jgi:tetratricopeptide (TPR) repeat protein
MVAGFRRYCACIVASVTILMAGTPESRAAADDKTICAEQPGDVAIAACSRAITSGRYKGHALATVYGNRGVEWKLKKEYDRALADQSEAIRIDAAFADAFYNRCIRNLKEDYDQALGDCSRAIELGPSANAMSPSGARLGDDVTSSDYYRERGFTYLRKREYDHAIADFDNAIRLNPKNPKSFENRGLAYEAKGDAARAQADSEMATQLGK